MAPTTEEEESQGEESVGRGSWVAGCVFGGTGGGAQ